MSTTTDPCWKIRGNDMFEWALEWELSTGNQNHGLGDLSIGCDFAPGETCPACGQQWPMPWGS